MERGAFTVGQQREIGPPPTPSPRNSRIFLTKPDAIMDLQPSESSSLGSRSDLSN